MEWQVLGFDARLLAESGRRLRFDASPLLQPSIDEQVWPSVVIGPEDVGEFSGLHPALDHLSSILGGKYFRRDYEVIAIAVPDLDDFLRAAFDDRQEHLELSDRRMISLSQRPHPAVPSRSWTFLRYEIGNAWLESCAAMDVPMSDVEAIALASARSSQQELSRDGPCYAYRLYSVGTHLVGRNEPSTEIS